jgi:MaoC like domain
VHTDARLARRGGLDGPIYQGSAMLAHCVSVAVAEALGGDPALVRRVGCRFVAAVPMPSAVTVAVGDAGRVVCFAARLQDGTAVVADGFVEKT